MFRNKVEADKYAKSALDLYWTYLHYGSQEDNSNQIPKPQFIIQLPKREYTSVADQMDFFKRMNQAPAKLKTPTQKSCFKNKKNTRTKKVQFSSEVTGIEIHGGVYSEFAPVIDKTIRSMQDSFGCYYFNILDGERDK